MDKPPFAFDDGLPNLAEPLFEVPDAGRIACRTGSRMRRDS